MTKSSNKLLVLTLAALFFPQISMATLPSSHLTCVIQEYRAFDDKLKAYSSPVGSDFNVDLTSGVVLGARVSNTNEVYRRDVAEDTDSYSVTWTNTGRHEPPAILFVGKEDGVPFWYADHVRLFSGHCSALRWKRT